MGIVFKKCRESFLCQLFILCSKRRELEHIEIKNFFILDTVHTSPLPFGILKNIKPTESYGEWYC